MNEQTNILFFKQRTALASVVAPADVSRAPPATHPGRRRPPPSKGLGERPGELLQSHAPWLDAQRVGEWQELIAMASTQ